MSRFKATSDERGQYMWKRKSGRHTLAQHTDASHFLEHAVELVESGNGGLRPPTFFESVGDFCTDTVKVGSRER